MKKVSPQVATLAAALAIVELVLPGLLLAVAVPGMFLLLLPAAQSVLPLTPAVGCC